MINNLKFAKISQVNNSKEACLISNVSYSEGDIICSFNESKLVKEPTYLTIQTSPNTHIELIPQLLDRINHSCSPNVFFDVEAKQLIALKTIEKETELTFFYPSTEWKMVQPFTCFCSEKECIGTVEGASYLSVEILSKYRLSKHISLLKGFCPCGSSLLFSECCDAIIKAKVKAPSAEKLMRSRYTAYTIAAIDYLLQTTHSSQRNLYSPKEMEIWAKESNWQKLEILNSTENTVEFRAYFIDKKGNSHIHFEKSTFVFENDQWYYLDGVYS